MRALLGRLFAAACLVLPLCAAAQQEQPANGLLLIAKPTLSDPNFSQTVVLVTQTEDGGTVGVIVNRPTTLRLRQFLSEEFDTSNYRDPVYIGGPVMRQAVVALFRSKSRPAAPAFHVLKDVYLTMHADNIKPLLADKSARYRVYAGFSGWSPRQLESEFMRDGWYFLQADEATVFRKDTKGLWQELLERAQKADPRGRS
ncbi:MAG: YqgE/AlgH family protein [Burkholderiales bacterium]